MGFRGTKWSKSQYYRRKRRADALGCAIEDVPSMIGKHGNHASGDRNGRWNKGRITSSEGYVLVRVAHDFPHSFGSPGMRKYRYAYEHIVVMVAHIGRAMRDDEVVHHRNGNRSDNRLENLELTTRGAHARGHANSPSARDLKGRFAGGRKRPILCD